MTFSRIVTGMTLMCVDCWPVLAVQSMLTLCSSINIVFKLNFGNSAITRILLVSRTKKEKNIKNCYKHYHHFGGTNLQIFNKTL